MAQEVPGQTLQATALVHEAYLRLTGDPDCQWNGARHFFGAAAEALSNAHAQAGDFLKPPAEDPPDSEHPATMIGRDKLLQSIGEGGFGRVYMVEQLEPVRRKVALKIVKLGVGKHLQTYLEYPPQQKPGSFSLDPLLQKLQESGGSGKH